MLCQRKLGGELEKQTELLQKVLADKESEITKIEDRLRQAKEEVIHEYRNSNALLAKLGGSFAEGFDDCLCQVKAPHPDLDLSNITLMLQPRLSFNPSLLRVQMSCLPMMFLAMERLLKLRITPVTLTCKMRMSKILQFSSSSFVFLFFFIW